MLEQVSAIPTIGVKNMEAARDFYENKLGLEPVGEGDEEVQNYQAGDSTIQVYKSEFGGTNKATSVTFALGEKFDKVLSDLKERGVKFEHYNLPDTEIMGDVHTSGDMKMAWFKDPDGNILCIHAG